MLALSNSVDAQTYSTVHNFSATNDNGSGSYTNRDGANPYAALLLADGVLYGTSFSGGDAGVGTLFKVNTDGSGFTNLHSFTGSSSEITAGPLAISGNTLYGTYPRDGSAHGGSVFKVNTDGSGYTVLKEFVGSYSDGLYPIARYCQMLCLGTKRIQSKFYF